jgi:tetratricopeptide (TPR) repeat protein
MKIKIIKMKKKLKIIKILKLIKIMKIINNFLGNLNLLNYSQCIKDCSDSLQNDPKNAKSYFRRGLGYKKLGNLQKSLSDFHSALSIDPSNQNIQKEIQLVTKIVDKRRQEFKN